MIEENVKPPFMSNSLYNVLKWVSLILLPATGTLYSILASAWNLPGGQEVMTTVLAFGTFLGTLLQISKNRYDKFDEAENTGELSMTETVDPEVVEAGLPGDLEVRFDFPKDLGTYSEGDLIKLRVGEILKRGKHSLQD